MTEKLDFDIKELIISVSDKFPGRNEIAQQDHVLIMEMLKKLKQVCQAVDDLLLRHNQLAEASMSILIAVDLIYKKTKMVEERLNKLE